MPRKRQIDPSFWTDSELAKISDKAKLLYIGLWNYADDNGILPYDPAEIRVSIFPYNPQIKIENYLQELFKIKKLIEYEIEGKKYIWIKNFLKHQKFVYPSYRYPFSEEIKQNIVNLKRTLSEGSLNPHRTFTDASQRMNRDEMNRENRKNRGNSYFLEGTGKI